MSIAKFDTWQRLDTTPVQTILQVKNTLYTTPSSQSVTTGTETPISGIEVNITPYSASSRILIMARWTGEITTNTHDVVFFISRNNTKINSQSAADAGARMSGAISTAINYAASSGPDNNTTPDSAFISTIDSPNTTDELTYKLGIITGNNVTVYANRTIADTNELTRERTTSEIIVMEIAA